MAEFKLYELTEELEQAYDLFVESADEDGVIPDDVMEAFNKVSAMFDEKVAGMGQMIKRIESKIDICKKEEERIYKIRKSFEKKIEYLKSYIINNMQAVGKKKVETLQGKLLLTKSKAVNLLDMGMLNEKFKLSEITIKADKKAIKEAIENGELVEGAELVENTSLRIC